MIAIGCGSQEIFYERSLRLFPEPAGKQLLLIVGIVFDDASWWKSHFEAMIQKMVKMQLVKARNNNWNWNCEHLVLSVGSIGSFHVNWILNSHPPQNVKVSAGAGNGALQVVPFLVRPVVWIWRFGAPPWFNQAHGNQQMSQPAIPLPVHTHTNRSQRRIFQAHSVQSFMSHVDC